MGRGTISKMCARCRRSFRRWKRFCTILVTPRKLTRFAFEFMDRWVTRRTIVTFTMLEALAAAGAALFFTLCRDVSELGFLIKSWIFFPLVMIIRFCSSLLGFVAGIKRKVKLTKLYFVSLTFNIPITVFVCVPLWNCKCECNRLTHEMLAGEDHDSIQCKILFSFMRGSEIGILPNVRHPARARRLVLNRNDSAPRMDSYAAAVARAIADTVGTTARNRSSFFTENIHWTRDVPRSPSTMSLATAWSRWHNNSNRLARILHQSTDVSQRLHSSMARRARTEAPARRTGNARKSPIKSIEGFILHFFYFTPDGIEWVSDSKANGGKENQCDQRSEDSADEIKEALLYINHGDRLDLFYDALEGEKSWAIHLNKHLQECVRDDMCGAMQAEVMETDKGIIFRTCQYNLPIFPKKGGANSDKHVSIFLQKNVVIALNSILVDQFEEDASADKCYAVVTLVMLSLVLLNALSIPMFVVVLKFLNRRCGDFLSRERQFTVEFSSEEEDWDDDFTISTGSLYPGSSGRSRNQSSSPGATGRAIRGGAETADGEKVGSHYSRTPRHWNHRPRTESGQLELSSTDISNQEENNKTVQNASFLTRGPRLPASFVPMSGHSLRMMGDDEVADSSFMQSTPAHSSASPTPKLGAQQKRGQGMSGYLYEWGC